MWRGLGVEAKGHCQVGPWWVAGWFRISSSCENPCGFQVASWASWFRPGIDQDFADVARFLHPLFSLVALPQKSSNLKIIKVTVRDFIWGKVPWSTRESHRGWRCRYLDSSRFVGWAVHQLMLGIVAVFPKSPGFFQPTWDMFCQIIWGFTWAFTFHR